MIKEPISLSEVVKDCARAAQVLAVRKGVRLKLENDSPSIALNGDEELIKRMILNLLDNAVKYTPEGGEISLALEQQNGSAEIVVRDTGIGISETDQQHVFDRFYRVDKARSRASAAPDWGSRSCAALLRLTEDKSGSKALLVTAAPSLSPLPAKKPESISHKNYRR